MRQLLDSAVFGGVLLFCLGCVSTGDLVESRQLERSLASFSTIGIQVSSKEKKYRKYLRNFKVVLQAQLEDAELFDEVKLGKSKDLMLGLKIMGVDEGSGFARAMNVGGEAEIKLKGRLFDVRNRKTLSEFMVTGNSARKSETSIGGVKTSWFDDLTARALGAAAEQVVIYLEENKNK